MRRFRVRASAAAASAKPDRMLKNAFRIVQKAHVAEQQDFSL